MATGYKRPLQPADLLGIPRSADPRQISKIVQQAENQPKYVSIPQVLKLQIFLDEDNMEGNITRLYHRRTHHFIQSRDRFWWSNFRESYHHIRDRKVIST